MTKVYIYDRVTGDKQGYCARVGDTIDHYLPDGVDFDLYLNSHLVTCEKNYKLEDGDVIYAFHRPEGADPVTVGIIVAVVVALVTVALLPRPEKPNQQGVQRQSPNNQITGQTNISRAGGGIPDIKGQIRSFPDLAQSAWYSWEENRRRVRERFCVGVSSLDITNVRDNEVEFSRIPGSDFTIVERNVTVDDQYPIRATSLDDARLLAENQRIIELNYIYLANDGGINYVIVGVTPDQDIPTLLDLNNEASFVLSGTDSSTINQEFFIDRSNPIVTSTEVIGITFNPSGLPVDVEILSHRIPVTVPQDFPAYSLGSCTIRQGATCFPDYVARGFNLNDGFFIIGSINTGEITDGFTQWTLIGSEGVGSFTWYTNLIFESGLIMNDGSSETTSFQVQARDSVTMAAATFTVFINDQAIGTGSDVSFNVSGRTRGALGRTVRFTQTQPNIENRVEFRIRRTSDLDLANSVSDATIETVFSLVRYPLDSLGPEFTFIDVDARSDFTNRSTSSRRINCLVAKKQRSYVSATDTITLPDSSNRSFADAITDDFVNLFGETRARSILDLSSLYAVSDSLNDNLKEFSYSFDDINISLGQRIHTACNVARVGAFRDGQTWRFFREEIKPVTAVFDRRTIAGNSESMQTVDFQKPNGNDSIRLGYINPIDNKERHIERRILNGAIVSGVGSRPLEIDLAGCRNEEQAINRAEIEIRRLVYQRRRVSERVLDDGLIVDIGDRVRWACIYDNATTDGEVLEIFGDQLRISEQPVFEDGQSYFGHITDDSGSVHGPYQIIQGSNGDFWVDGFDTSFAYIAQGRIQLGSRVIIGTTSDLNYYDFILTAKTPADDGTVQVELIEYDERMFSED